MNDQPDDNVPSTCDLCDAHRGDTDGAFRVLPPLFRDFGGRTAFHGPVSTVRCLDGQGLRDVMLDLRGVRVRPGDWLYADADGIVLLPHRAATS